MRKKAKNCPLRTYPIKSKRQWDDALQNHLPIMRK